MPVLRTYLPRRSSKHPESADGFQSDQRRLASLPVSTEDQLTNVELGRSDEDTLMKNSLAYAVRDRYPVTERHVLVVPRRHTPDYFDLGTAELRAC